MDTNHQNLPAERSDLLETLAKHRHFLRYAVRDLSDDQASAHPTASALCLGGIIKHVAAAERGWAAFIADGPRGMAAATESAGAEDWNQRFQIAPGEHLASVLDHYAEVAQHTDELVATYPDLDVAHPLPDEPWFERGASWSARRVVLHIIAETSQHAGHADILRESIDGAKTMG